MFFVVRRERGLDGSCTLDAAGAIIAPLNPGFYLRPRSLDDIVDFMAGKLLDLLEVPHDLATRWEEHVK